MKPSIALLDPLRALSAGAVIAWHLSHSVQYKMPLFASAAFAVDIFMNISGFLMMYHYLERRRLEPWESPRTWGRFMVRRFFRIAPLYFLLLLFVWWFNFAPTSQTAPAAGFRSVDEGGFSSSRFDLKFLFMHASFLFGLFPSYTGDNILPDWSLSLEMQFYAFFPFLALLAGRVGTAGFFFGCCLVSAIANQLVGYYAGSPPGILGWYPHPSILPLKLHVFAVGIVAASVYVNGPRELQSRWYIPAFILFALTCKFNYTRLLGSAYLLLYLSALMPKSRQYLNRAISGMNGWCEQKDWFRWPAELSYSAYLTHNIVIVLIFGWASAGVVNQSIPTYRFILIYALILALVAILGVVLHLFVERPGIRIGKYLLGRTSKL